uniref:Uncharacterized protein n=1 Tax=Lepeophtheirus salmonis TaxID=72036 RepID=A0A0K2T740_LEPSM
MRRLNSECENVQVKSILHINVCIQND